MSKVGCRWTGQKREGQIGNLQESRWEMTVAGRGQVAKMEGVEKWSDLGSILQAELIGFGNKTEE